MTLQDAPRRPQDVPMTAPRQSQYSTKKLIRTWSHLTRGAIFASRLEPSWGPSWIHTWSHLTLGAILASHLEPSWSCTWSHFGAILASHLEPYWHHTWSTWSHLGARVWRAGSIGEPLRSRTHVLPSDIRMRHGSILRLGIQRHPRIGHL